MDSQQNAKTISERRKYPRIQTENDVDYILLDTNEDLIDQGKGKTLNLSQSGTLLKTEKPLNGAFVILVTLDLNGKKVKIKGQVANTRKSDKPGYYLTGIEFKGSKEEQIEAIVAFVKAYHHGKQRNSDKKLHSVKYR